LRIVTIAITMGLLTGCSLDPLNTAFSIRETSVEKIQAPRSVKAGEPIKVSLTAFLPSSCETFSHLKVDRRDGGKLYVFKAYTKDQAGRTDHCAAVAGYAERDYIILDAPGGMITLMSEAPPNKVTVMVE
jgi:hypothetical protein